MSTECEKKSFLHHGLHYVLKFLFSGYWFCIKMHKYYRGHKFQQHHGLCDNILVIAQYHQTQ